VTQQGNHVRFAPVELPDSAQLRLNRLYRGSVVKPAVRTILVPRPMTAPVAGTPLRDAAVLRWASDLIEAVLVGSVAGAAAVAAGAR
jgi:transcription-repair coupling factor (superfamily II helicase)